MELKWLEDFTCLAITLSFSRAAEERRITQPAFSRRIKQLEAWLGVTLVSRVTFPAELTKEGKAFLPVAQEAIRNFYSTREALQPPKAQKDQTLTFSALHTLTVVFFPQWLQQMQARFGGLRTRMSPDKGGIEENIGTLVEGEADFLLTYAHASVPFLMDSSRFPYLVLGTERLLPVSSPAPEGALLDHAINNGIPIPYLSYGDFSFFGVALSKLFASKPRFERRVVHQNTISIGLKTMAVAGWGVAWLPEGLIREELEAGTLVRATEDPSWDIEVEIRIYRHASSARAIVDEFWRAVGENLR
ncbi:DNA-binding transcriptional LysR family regulator [Mesorhizobium soli]|jgi:DNA-binding transcriptional LysR family regulator|uniref:LysR family transcriptional regulator n=1 Tax=Pseudaminobacter soli (ex Li et al. 2025) TaxID=1295366 RepID=UPI002473C638|nr:LysR family transcriptional regulator [Mesorhizobium soli]MDH6233464.1 DNA-binding transcriptional LysR family regulator [Mesorhizobium soli]